MKQIYLLLLLVALMLAACSDEPKQTPIKKDFERTEVQLTIVIHDNWRGVSKAYHKEYPKSNRKTTRHGYAVWFRGGNHENACTIHIVMPKNLEDDYQFQTIGHELTHCIHGTFHKE